MCVFLLVSEFLVYTSVAFSGYGEKLEELEINLLQK